MNDKIKVTVGELCIIFDVERREWVPEEEDAEVMAMLANVFTRLQRPYSPADGAFGYHLATEVAKALHGKATLPEVKPSNDHNKIY